RANGGGSGDDVQQTLAAGVVTTLYGDYGITRFTNAAGGVVEATGSSSAAVIAVGETGYGDYEGDPALRLFELDNGGIIRGGPDTAVAAGTFAYAGGDNIDIGDAASSDRTIAGG